MVVGILVAATLVAPASLLLSSGSTSNHNNSSLPSPSSVSASPAVRPDSTGTGCQSGSHGGASTAAGTSGAPSRSQLRPRTSDLGPTPETALFNSQVTPFAVLTGPYAYVAKGAALRDQGYGQINLTWPGSSTSNLVAAYMLWSEMNNSVPPSYGWLNGVNITGSWTAYATPSPCWSQTYIYTFIAEVTKYVKNGINNLTNFPSSLTNGYDPWNQSETGILDEGVSLIAIYDSHSSTDQQITVYSGSLTSEGQTLSAQLNYSTTNRTNATTTYIVADGQLPGNEAEWNGTVIDADAFPGSDPHESPYTWSYGNLSDTKTFSVNVTLGSNNTTAAMFPTDSDCFTWVGQVLDVGVRALPPPYTVTFQEQGLNNGMTWKVTTNGTTHTGTVSGGTSSLKFKVLNGTYTYSISPVPGFAPSALSGNYTIAGGPDFIRVLFHQVVYPITFNETGLPNSSTWEVTLTNSSQGLDDLLTAYTPEGVVFYVPNGTYNFTDSETGLYLPTPANGSLTVDGSGLVEQIAFRPPLLFNVTIEVHGLPTGTLWGADVVASQWGSFQNTTTNSSYTLELPNATLDSDYAQADAVTGFEAPSGVYFGVFAAPETVQLNYSPLYPVYLNETGLPTGTAWYADLSGAPGYYYGYSSNSTIQYEVPNGSYTFDVTEIWAYTAVPDTGTIVVNGAFANATVDFVPAPTYTVTFNETGLPAGTPWSVTFGLPNAHVEVVNSTGTNLTVPEPNGSYTYLVPPTHDYAPTVSSGYFYVEGAPIFLTVTFVREYAVTFTEHGLPSGTNWATELDISVNSSTSNTIGFTAENGTHDYYVYPIETFEPTPGSGSLTVDGANVSVEVNYTSTTEPTYNVTFTESGLPTGTNWSVLLYGYLEWTTGASLNFTEANGTMDFTVGGGIGFVANPASGMVTVSGGPVVQPIVFSAPTGKFLVTFQESGLPTGATWYVNITGQTGLVTTVGASSGRSASISLSNATYTFSAATSDKSWTTASGGHFTVAGSSLTESVIFTAVTPPTTTYLVTFVEENLPSGVTWYVNITGQSSLSATVSSASGTDVTIDLANASYSYTTASNAKAWTATGGSFSVSGAAHQVTIPFTSSSTTSPPGSPSTSSGPAVPWLWLGAAVVGVGLLFLILFAVWRRRKKEPKPPATWQAGSTGTGPGNGSPPSGKSP